MVNAVSPENLAYISIGCGQNFVFSNVNADVTCT